MRIIHWIVCVVLSHTVHSRYHFRFHTCIKEDQKILDRENLNSLRQAAYIDDGFISGPAKFGLARLGIGIHYGSVLGSHNLTSNYQEGAESVLRVIEFYGSDYFIVINFFHRGYYFMKKGDAWRMSPLDVSIKPSLKHFVRVYFICAPGNARSALILFGPQSKLRGLVQNHQEKIPTRKTKTVKREMKEVNIGGKIVKKCRKMEGHKKREKRGIGKDHGEFGTPIPNMKDKRRLMQRAMIYVKVCILMAHSGVGATILINSLALFIFFCAYKKAKPIKLPKDKDKTAKGSDGTGTTETKTKSERQLESQKNK
ncbi:unnamed protein product [Caenorhabditis brenneri]